MCSSDLALDAAEQKYRCREYRSEAKLQNMRLGAVTVSSVGSHHAKQNAPEGAKFLRSSASLAARFRFQSASGNACAVNLKDSNTSTCYGYDRKSIVTSITMSRVSQSDGCEGRNSCADLIYSFERLAVITRQSVGGFLLLNL